MGEQKNQIVNSFFERKYGELLQTLIRRYHPVDGTRPQKKLRFFQSSGATVQGLLQDAAIKLLETLDEDKLLKISDENKDRFLFGCMLTAAEQIFLNECKAYARRIRIHALNDLSQEPATPATGAEAFEFEEAMSHLSPDERALIRNSDMSIEELRRRMASSTSQSTFWRKRKDKLDKIAKILNPE